MRGEIARSASVLGEALARVLRVYQWIVSPWLSGGACRFYPSCSEYAQVVLRRDGALRGGWRTLRRLVRCTPGQRGGLDLP